MGRPRNRICHRIFNTGLLALILLIVLSGCRSANNTPVKKPTSTPGDVGNISVLTETPISIAPTSSQTSILTSTPTTISTLAHPPSSSPLPSSTPLPTKTPISSRTPISTVEKLPDILVENILIGPSISPKEVEPIKKGDLAYVSLSFANIGLANIADNTIAMIYVGESKPDNKIKEISIPPLAQGESYKAPLFVFTPIINDKLEFVVVADALEQVRESSETNNSSKVTLIIKAGGSSGGDSGSGDIGGFPPPVVPNPSPTPSPIPTPTSNPADLAVASISIGPEANPTGLLTNLTVGVQYYYKITFNNPTSIDITTLFTISLYENTISLSTKIGEQNVASLLKNSSSSQVIPFTILSSSSINLIAVLDSGGVIQETNENNNQHIQTVNLSAPSLPDLVPANIPGLTLGMTIGTSSNPTTLQTGLIAGVAYNIGVGYANTGQGSAGQFGVAVYRNSIDPSNMVGQCIVDSLAAGASGCGIIPWTFSVAGSAYLIAVIDSQNQVNEINEVGNESIPTAITIFDPVQLAKNHAIAALRDVIRWSLEDCISSLPRNPHLEVQYNTKIAMLQDPNLYDNIVNGDQFIVNFVSLSDGRRLEVVAAFPLASMRQEAGHAVDIVSQSLPLLEDFFAVPYPSDGVYIWYGFALGARGSVGRMNLEDQTTYEARWQAGMVPYDPIICHELSHTYIFHESLNQFLEIYTFNRIIGHSTDFDEWTYVRNYDVYTGDRGGYIALLDIYKLIGFIHMENAYRIIYPLNPPYGITLADECKQVFINQAPPEHQLEVAALVANLDR
jgi:hypothetical protein